MDFWAKFDQMLATSEIVIDRKKGSRHPRFPDIIYPLDYGYLEGTSGGDGNEIDVWRGSLTDGKLVAVICTVDLKKCDSEVKLLIGCTEDEIGIVDAFHNYGDLMSGIIIMRSGAAR